MNMLARSVLLRAIACIFLAMSGTLALADEPPLPSNASASTKDDQVNALLDAKSSYEQRILGLEQQHGAYYGELGDAYLGLGSTLQALGEDEEAYNALWKSMQAFRTSDGLQNLRQLPALQALVVSSRNLGKWSDVDTLHYLIYHITTRQFAAGNDTRQQAALQLARWKLEATGKNLLPARSQPSIEAIELLQKEIRSLQAANNGNDLPMAALYLELASAELLEAKRAYDLPVRDYESEGEKETVVEQQCETIRGPDGRMTRVCTATEVPNTQNYLLAKSRNKDFEIATHMNFAKDAVNQTVGVLQRNRTNGRVHRELLTRAGTVITQYNDFMKSLTDTTHSRIKR